MPLKAEGLDLVTKVVYQELSRLDQMSQYSIISIGFAYFVRDIIKSIFTLRVPSKTFNATLIFNIKFQCSIKPPTSEEDRYWKLKF